ncbi:MAG: ABC transporter ATP-binding protein [Deltaproteobacteria bacterium]|jgi:branched-chain amino acid transport system ATP-binding protein|nr:MAG: ABC transporter ATP-binding protein [Deltaproteobacteria bacterium]RPJ39429.1 MAG: ABC transporter ATP-binding protein [Deltaproteobacteria bacterium]
MILGVEKVKKSFDGFVAINGVSFSIPKGEICSIIGPNGAGKTTLFNLITGHLPSDEGKLTFKDLDITGRPPHQICRLGVGRSFQRTNIFPRLTVFQNIQAAVLAHRGKSFTFFRPVDSFFQEETGEILERVGLGEYAQMVSGSLSYGFQKQLELGIALASEPELLLLDEPTAGMSVQETHQTMEMIAKITREKGLTLLFTEHDMEVVFSISQRIMVLYQGRLIAEGMPGEVRNNPEVQKVYLGEGR